MKTYATLKLLSDGCEIYDEKGVVIFKTIAYPTNHYIYDKVRSFNEIARKGWSIELQLQNNANWYLISKEI